jgi:hypothetical protein
VGHVLVVWTQGQARHPAGVCPPPPPTVPPLRCRRCCRIAPEIFVSVLGSYSVLAIYVTIVLAVGQLVRSGFATPSHRIPFTEMPDCTELLELCEGIRAARASPHPGALIDEMQLLRLLLRLCRSPEALIRITRRKTD